MTKTLGPRLGRQLAGVLALALTGALTLAPPSYADVAAGSVTLTALSIDRGTVSPAGLTTVDATVTVHLRSADPISQNCVDGDSGGATSGGPYVRLVRTGPADPAAGGLAR